MFFAGRSNRRQPQGGKKTPLDLQAESIESILRQLNHPPETARMDNDSGYGWVIHRGSAEIDIYLSQQSGVGYLQVLSPIMHIATDKPMLPFYRHLLELNLSLTSAALGIHEDIVYVYYERKIDGLDAHEANEIIRQVARYADELDNQLVREFGGRLYMQVKDDG